MARNDLKYMEAAIAVAEELSFSRAARRLHLSQPAVTKQIAELEESLGLILFYRDHHVVSLTDAGRAFVEEARVAVLHAERAIHAARATEKNAELILNIGRSPYADPFFISTLLTTRLPLFPRLRLNLSSGFSCDLTREVLSGELDLAVVIEPPISDLFTSVRIDESPFYVVMSHDDELANHQVLTLEQLVAKRWILFQRHSHPPLYDLIGKLARERRVIAAGIQHFMVPEEAIPLMTDPGGIVILPKSGALRIAKHGLTLRPLEESSLILNTLLISRADNDSKVAGELVRSFMRRMKYLIADEQLSLQLPV